MGGVDSSLALCGCCIHSCTLFACLAHTRKPKYVAMLRGVSCNAGVSLSYTFAVYSDAEDFVASRVYDSTSHMHSGHLQNVITMENTVPLPLKQQPHVYISWTFCTHRAAVTRFLANRRCLRRSSGSSMARQSTTGARRLAAASCALVIGGCSSCCWESWGDSRC